MHSLQQAMHDQVTPHKDYECLHFHHIFNTSTCFHAYMCTSTHAWMNMWIYIYICMHMCISWCMHQHIHTHTTSIRAKRSVQNFRSISTDMWYNYNQDCQDVFHDYANVSQVQAITGEHCGSNFIIYMLSDHSARACEHRYMHKYIHTYIHTYIHAHIHTYMHTCINTYMHTCIHA